MADFKEIMVDGQVYQVKDETARNSQGGYEPPTGGIPKADLASDVQTSLGKADTALQQADKTQLQSAINSLQSALDTLIGSGNVQGAIDTFNEVKAFLDGIDTDDPTLANQLLALNNAITALQTSLASKANSADVVPNSRTVNGKALSGNVTIGMSDIQGLETAIADAGKVKSVSVNGGTHEQPDAQGNVNVSVPTLTFDDAPTAGSNNGVKSGGVKTALDAKANAADVPTKTEMANAIDEKLSQVTVNAIPAGSVAVIDGYYSDSATDVLSAGKGKDLNDRLIEICGGITYEDVETVVEHTEDVTMTTGKYIPANQGVGQVCPMTMSSSTINDCAIVNLQAGQKLEIKGVGGNGSRLWAILDKNTHVIQSVADANNSATGIPIITKTIVAETDCIVVVNVYNANGTPPYGNDSNTPYSVKLTTYETQTIQVPVPVGGILEDMQNNINAIAGGVITKYVTSDVTMTTGKYIPCNQGVGQVCPMTEASFAADDCAIVNLNAGETLEIKGVGGNGSRLWAILDKNTHVIQSVADANVPAVGQEPVNPFTKTIVAESDCIVVVNVYNVNGDPPYGNQSETPYSVKVTKEVTTIHGGALGSIQNELDEHEDRFDDIEEQIDGVLTGDKALEMTTTMPSTAAAFHALWDKFVTDGWAVRTTIASPNSKPVYLYHIDPYNKIVKNQNNTAAFTVADNDYFQKKKILITSGIHGDEKQTPLWLYEFFNRILYNDEFAAMRSAFDFYVVPLVNPTGYDANTRNNYNNVNINRDFKRQTQVETQAVCDLIDNGNFDMYLDSHQLSGGSGKSNISPAVCAALICSSTATDDTLRNLCTMFSKGGARADIALNKRFNKSVAQSCFAWPPITVTGDDMQSHEYGAWKGIADSFEFEFTQYAYQFSGSDTIYNNGSMVYGNTVFHYLMMEFLN